MTDKFLQDKIDSSANRLEEITTILSSGSGKLVGETQAKFEAIVDSSKNLRNCIGLLEYRRSCWDSLAAVRDHSNEKESVAKIGSKTIPFDQARYLTTQAYIAAHWALADVIAQVAGRILCTEDVNKNRSRTPNLWQHFLQDGKSAPWLAVHSLRECFAWPVGVSYIIRNFFTHEGGVGDNWLFFEGVTPADRFIMTGGALNYINKKATEYKISPSLTRAGDLDLNQTRDVDLVLQRCHREIDDILAILTSIASLYARSFIELLVEDH